MGGFHPGVELEWGGSVTNGAYLVIHRLVSPRHQAVEQGRPKSVSYPGVNYQQLPIVTRTHLRASNVFTHFLSIVQYCHTVDKRRRLLLEL